MLEVLALILAASRLPASEPYHRQEIATILAERPLDELLRGVPAEEAEELLHDMRLLRLA